MKYEKALEIGRTRADMAAEVIQRWAGVKAIAVCAVKSAYGQNLEAREWEPVGKQSYKEIARDDGMLGGGNYHLLVVDKAGTAKACSMERFPLDKVLNLADRLPLIVAASYKGELWKQLVEWDSQL